MKRFEVQLVATTMSFVDADTLKDAEQLAIARANNLKEVGWFINDSQLVENGDEDCDCDEFGFDDDDCEDDDEDDNDGDCEDDNEDDDEDDCENDQE